MFDQKMIVRFKDGRTLTAFGDGFMVGEAEIMVKDLNERIHTVRLDEVKLVCFVKHFVTDSQNTHRQAGTTLYQAIPGRKARITFRDGEKLVGIISCREKPRSGFFIASLNPNSNNIHIYVNAKEVVNFTFLD